MSASSPVAGLVTVVIPFLADYESLDACLESVRRQTFRPIETLVVENGSPRPVESSESIQVIRNESNFGFSKAVNQGFEAARGEFLLILNSDAVLGADYVERCVGALEFSSRRGAVTGKLFKSDLNGVIDSTGHILLRDRTVRDRGEWETDTGRYDNEDELFSIPATAALYRMSALRHVASVVDELLDEDFFAYGEDVDLGWRLHLLGWSIAYAPAAVAMHRRAASKMGGRAPDYVTLLDVRNRWLRMVKNDHPRSLIRHLWPILRWEVRQMASMVLKSPRVVPFVIAGFIRRLPMALRKRRRIQKARALDWRVIDYWFKSSTG
jgi:GT2 family glycosyltransferase